MRSRRYIASNAAARRHIRSTSSSSRSKIQQNDIVERDLTYLLVFSRPSPQKANYFSSQISEDLTTFDSLSSNRRIMSGQSFGFDVLVYRRSVNPQVTPHWALAIYDESSNTGRLLRVVKHEGAWIHQFTAMPDVHAGSEGYVSIAGGLDGDDAKAIIDTVADCAPPEYNSRYDGREWVIWIVHALEKQEILPEGYYDWLSDVKDSSIEEFAKSAGDGWVENHD